MQRPVLRLSEPPTHPQARRVWSALFGWFSSGEFSAIEASMCLVEELGIDHRTAIAALQKLDDVDAIYMVRALHPSGLLKPLRDPSKGENGYKKVTTDILADLTSMPYEEF